MEPIKKVYTAINAVSAEVATLGIGKTQENEQQGFKFRGIDDVYDRLAPIIAKHKLVIIPRMVERTMIERTSVSNRALYDVVSMMEYDVISAEDGSCHVARMAGEAMDSGDKATSKSASMAYKYMCFQLFCIPTRGENDADSGSHEAKPSSEASKASGEAKAGPAGSSGRSTGQRRGAAPSGPMVRVTKIKRIDDTRNPNFKTLVTVEDIKAGLGTPELIDTAFECFNTGEDVRLTITSNGRFKDVTNIERRTSGGQPPPEEPPAEAPSGDAPAEEVPF